MKNILMIIAAVIAALGIAAVHQNLKGAQAATKESIPMEEKDLRVATFAGGCFWCVEADFEKLPGVKNVKLAGMASVLGRGGTGLYPGRNFVHIDTGDERVWVSPPKAS